MTEADIRDRIVRALERIAPEARGAALHSTVALRDQLDLDSMDVLNFAIALHREFGIDIAETDYPRLATLDDAVRFLAEKRLPPG